MHNDNIKYYKIINMVALCFVLYAAMFPLFSPVLSHVFPNICTCYYKELTGNGCPICGATRDIKEIFYNFLNFSGSINPLSMFIALIILGEIIFRGYIAIFINKIPHTKLLITVDGIVHSALLLFVVGYYVYFFVYGNSG